MSNVTLQAKKSTLNSTNNRKIEEIYSTSNAVHTRTAASDVADRASWFVDHAGTAADVNDNTVVFETGDVSMYNHHEFSIVTAPGAGAVEVFVSHDGTNYEATPIQVIDDALVIGAVVQSLNAQTAIGNYYFDRKVRKWKIQNKGATTGAATVIRGSSSVL